MSITSSSIDHLDWTPDPGLGLRERAQEAWEEDRRVRDQDRKRQVAKLLEVAHRHISATLDVLNASNVQVKPKDNSDGDGEVLCEIDGMQFRLGITYPSGADADAEPRSISLSVKTGNNWTIVNGLADLGQLLERGTITCVTG